MNGVAEVTIGIDIGTSSVKAIAADADGVVLRAARIPHPFFVPTPMRFEHDASVSWRAGVFAALEVLDAEALRPRGISVSAMVPSLAPVDSHGVPIGPGLLYGDERGQAADGSESGELARFLGWLAREYPHAAGYWPAQAVANAALCGEGVMSTTAAAACYPLFDFTGWNAELVAEQGTTPERLPVLAPGGQPVGAVRLGASLLDCVLDGGVIDAMAEQIVAGADTVGDVLVICGTTLITWAVVDEPLSIPGYFPIPHTTPGRFFIGGPSNAGGLFLNWASELVGRRDDVGDADLRPDAIPVWVPYPRGERVPISDPNRRAQLVDLDLTHGPAAVRRAAFEAAGFVARRMMTVSGVPPRRIVATGGGVRVPEWLQALADCTGLPVDTVRVPEGAALGAAWAARMAAGLETSLADARRWAGTAARYEPRAGWAEACDRRYERFLQLAN